MCFLFSCSSVALTSLITVLERMNWSASADVGGLPRSSFGFLDPGNSLDSSLECHLEDP